MKRFRGCSLRGALAAAAALLLAACAVEANGEAAYPRFSLVGTPRREVRYEYSISASDMRPITGRVSSNDRTLIVEVPAGRDRRIEFKAIDDVYSGAATVDLRPGTRTSVAIRLHPGPVFADYRGGRLAQFRDVGGIGLRTVEAEDAGVSPFRPADAEYDGVNGLWVVSNGGEGTAGLFRVTDLSPRNKAVFIEDGRTPLQPTAVAVDSRARRVYVATIGNGAAVHSVHLEDRSLDGQIVELGNLDLGLGVPVVSGMTVDGFGRLHLLIYDNVGQGQVALVTIDGVEGRLLAGPVHLPNAGVPSYSNRAPAAHPIGDVKTVGDELLVVTSAVPAGSPVVFRYDTNLRLRESWGMKGDADSTRPAVFRGPRRFVATREADPLLLIDQPDSDSETPEPGRIVAFRFGTTGEWATYEERGGPALFDTRVDTAPPE